MILLLCIVSVQHNSYSANTCLSLSYPTFFWIWNWKNSLISEILYFSVHKSQLYLLPISSFYIYKTVVIYTDREKQNKTKSYLSLDNSSNGERFITE